MASTEKEVEPSQSRKDMQTIQDIYTQAVADGRKMFLAEEVGNNGKQFKVQWQHGIPELQGDQVYTKYFIDSVARPPIMCPPGTSFNPETRECEPIVSTEMRVMSIDGTQTDPMNTLANVQDKKSGSRWSAKGHGSYLTLDMGQTRDIGAIRILWFKAFERSYTYDIDVGPDGVNWKNVYAKATSKIAPEPELIDMKRENCRFIKITIYGNTKNEWASITDVVVLSKYDPGFFEPETETILDSTS